MSSVICKDDQGAFIPATQRPDGSWRKPRRIKDGYVPQEEVPLYESRAKRQMQAAGQHYPPGLHPDLIKKKEMEKAKLNAGPVITYSPTPGVVLTQGGPPSEGKSKKKKKKKIGETNSENGSQGQPKQSTKNADSSQKVSKSAESSQKSVSKSADSSQKPESKPSTDTSSSPPTDPVKRLKNLRKKLQQIEAIEQKIADGQKDKLDKDQLEKVARKPDVLSEILALQLSIEGDN